jgi:hypothetical protein
MIITFAFFTFDFLKYSCVRFEVVTAAKMQMLIFWVLTPYGLVGRQLGLGKYTTLKMEEIFSFEMLVSTYKYTRKTNIDSKSS